MKTFFDLLAKVKSDAESNYLLSSIVGSNISSIPYGKFLQDVDCLASFLISIGFKRGDKMVIMMDSSPSWLLLDLAVIKAGGVSVPMFSTLSYENMVYQFENCAAEHIAVQNLEVFEIVRKTKFNFRTILTLNAFMEDFVSKHKSYTISTIDNALEMGKHSLETNKSVLEEIEVSADQEDTATIIYTSGTSGRPKGVELSHKNLISQLNAIDYSYGKVIKKEEDVVFSFLPLAHIFQRTVSYYFFSKCLPCFFSSNIKTIADDLEKIKPSFITVVPRFLEKVKNGINEKLKNESSAIKKIIGRACYNYASNHEPTAKHKFIYKIYDKLMYKTIREKLGGRLRVMISGGAALPDELYRFFINIGIPLYQGYGLTETSPVVCVNTPTENKIYTIGRPMQGIEVKLTSERELLVKGDNVMKGYYKCDNKDARVIDEQGFLYTGDLASIDSEGYVKIIGRKKEQFKTSNGKFINPIKIEAMLNEITYIETSCIVAEGRPFVTCILFPNEAGVNKLTQIEASLPNYIKSINSKLDKHEHIHYFYLHNKPATVEDGNITPSMKVIRTAIEKQFEYIIKDFYSKG